MITLYDLAFQEDRRPSPFVWRAKFALAHKGLPWTAVPCGFTEKDKIAFAGSQTFPVIKDGEAAVKDSWVIADHLDKAHADRPLFKSEMARSYALFVAGWVDTQVHAVLFPLVVADLVDRVRPEDKAYIVESRGKRIGTTDFAAFQARAREKGVTAFRAVVEPARRVLKVQNFLAGDHPAYPDYALMGAFMWARIVSPLSLLEAEDPVHAWRERMLDLYDGMGRKAKAA
ncbi:MAG: glutathione S-transferase N-terminal domain-containing protein [Reyranella sp.]|nr:glutathione S-transferase N-terminal domain-containing protein [Reyranella sp.]